MGIRPLLLIFVTGSARYANITPVLADLHWLPVEYRIQFKIAVTTVKVLTTCEPTYLPDIIRFYTPSRSLRSSGKNLLQDTRSKLAFADELLPRRTCSLEQFTTTFNSRLVKHNDFKTVVEN